jgi:ribosomal protein S18 acetylase RimI-like enzyme
MPTTSRLTLRSYRNTDEEGWLRCRLLAFLHTDYYDDVKTVRTADPQLAVCLVAIGNDELIGLIDVTVDGTAATIDSIAVHPDHQRQGLGTALLNAAITELSPDITTLDAWTREDTAANQWYVRSGFTENFRYLHVYKSWDEPADGFCAPHGLSTPLEVFAHAQIADENPLRQRFRRVYVCRQYLMHLTGSSSVDGVQSDNGRGPIMQGTP